MANLSKRDVKRLKEVRNQLEMNTCRFNPPGIDDRDLTDKECHTYTMGVKDATRLWRETWIFPTIDELIAKGEGRKL